MWGVNQHHDIYHRSTGKAGQWHKVEGKLHMITVSGDHGEHVWGCNHQHNIYFAEMHGGKQQANIQVQQPQQ